MKSYWTVFLLVLLWTTVVIAAVSLGWGLLAIIPGAVLPFIGGALIVLGLIAIIAFVIWIDQ